MIQDQLKELSQQEEFYESEIKDLVEKIRGVRFQRQLIQMECLHLKTTGLTEGDFDNHRHIQVCDYCGKEI